MSRQYLLETVASMQAAGFAAETETSTVTDEHDAPLYLRQRHSLTRGAHEELVLECLCYPGGRETFWIELRKILTLRALPFQLDSWKHHADHVEFRFYAREDGVALTFTLAL